MILHQTTNSVGNYNYNAYTYCDTVWPIHFHGNYELIYSTKGKTEVAVNGIPACLEEGSLLLIPPYATHSLSISKCTNTWVGVFSKDYIMDFATKYPFVAFSKFKCDEQIEQFLQTNLFHDRKPEHYMLTACLYLVCGQCVKHSKTDSESNTVDFVKDVILYMTENVTKNITMSETAAALHYEYHYFSALFHHYFSMNFKRFVNILRFELACELLSKENCNITEVCTRCGFESIRNFNRIFKSFSGMTPGAYKTRIS